MSTATATANRRHIPITGPMPNTDAWWNLRLYDPDREACPVLFGASEAAAVLGVSPWESPLDIYLKKRRTMKEAQEKRASEDSDAAFLGRVMEPGVIAFYCHKQGILPDDVITGLPTYFHPEHAFMACTPDAMNHAHDVPVVINAKTSTYQRYQEFEPDDHQFGKAGTDLLPMDYLVQAQQEMEVMGVDHAEYPVLFDGRNMRVYYAKRNNVIIDSLIKAEEALARCIIEGTPPAIDFSHKNTSAALRELYPVKPQSVCDLDMEALTNWNSVQANNQTIKALNKDNTEFKNKVREAMGTHEYGNLPGGTHMIHRSTVQESLWTQKDIDSATKNLGTTKRKGHDKLLQGKVK